MALGASGGARGSQLAARDWRDRGGREVTLGLQREVSWEGWELVDLTCLQNPEEWFRRCRERELVLKV